jgi:hypothetical protein
MAAAVPVIEDESPATKRARVHESKNFLHAHAGLAKNKQRGRGRGAAIVPAGASTSASSMKLTLGGLKTEKELAQALADAAATDSLMDASNSGADASSAIGIDEEFAVIALPTPTVRAPHPLHFKYNEGCTNAVRRTVNVAHFLPL